MSKGPQRGMCLLPRFLPKGGDSLLGPGTVEKALKGRGPVSPRPLLPFWLRGFFPNAPDFLGGEAQGAEEGLVGGGGGPFKIPMPLFHVRRAEPRFPQQGHPGGGALGQAAATQLRLGQEPGQLALLFAQALDVAPQGNEAGFQQGCWALGGEAALEQGGDFLEGQARFPKVPDRGQPFHFPGAVEPVPGRAAPGWQKQAQGFVVE